MKIYLISDNKDTYTGMRLAGVDGVVVHEKDDFINSLNTALEDKEIGIILITEHFNKEYSDIIHEIKLTRRTPLLVVIPDRHGNEFDSDFILSYINQAIGIKL